VTVVQVGKVQKHAMIAQAEVRDQAMRPAPRDANASPMFQKSGLDFCFTEMAVEYPSMLCSGNNNDEVYLVRPPRGGYTEVQACTWQSCQPLLSDP
jgi:hypothetical protein